VYKSQAQIAPPIIPARIEIVMTNTGDKEVSKNNLITPVVKIAPTVICPSIPIFHIPVVNVANNPHVTNSKGTQTTRTLEMRVAFPVAPSQISRNASRGCDFTNIKIMDTNNNENTRPPN
jgi:hypothetical protein